MEQYQDIGVKGEVQKVGVRECASRYEAIRDVCGNYTRPFTVLDIGANLGYFSLRLAEDFDCTVVMVEWAYAEWLSQVLRENGNDRTLAIKKIATVDALAELAEIERFDVVLAMSVVHYITDQPYQNLHDVLCRLGENLIIELPNESRACNPELATQTYPPEGSQQIGTGKSHLGGDGRGIWHVYRRPDMITKPFLDAPEDHVRAEVLSDYSSKRIRFSHKDEKEREFYRGINLWTWLKWGTPLYPGRKAVAEKARAAAIERLRAGRHGDLMPWNVILQGDAVQWIDGNDERANINDSWAMNNLAVTVLSNRL